MSFCRSHWQYYLQLTGKICFACKLFFNYLIRSNFMQILFLFCYYLHSSIHKRDVYIVKYYTNRTFQLGWFIFTLQTTWYPLENFFSHSYTRDYLRTWNQEFTTLSSHGLKWGNKPPKLKRFGNKHGERFTRNYGSEAIILLALTHLRTYSRCLASLF